MINRKPTIRILISEQWIDHHYSVNNANGETKLSGDCKIEEKNLVHIYRVQSA